jgi:hypothetical protein
LSIYALQSKRFVFRLRVPGENRIRLPMAWRRAFKRYRQLWHRTSSEQQSTGPGEPAGPARGACDSGAICCDSRIGIHLAIKPGNRQECQPAAHRSRAARSFPNLLQAVKLIPDFLGTLPNFIRGHRRMNGEYLWPALSRNQPVTTYRNTPNLRIILSYAFLPACKIYGARERSQHYELCGPSYWSSA